MPHKERPPVTFSSNLVPETQRTLLRTTTLITVATLLAALYIINETEEERSIKQKSATVSPLPPTDKEEPAFHPIKNTAPQEFGIVYGKPQPGDIVYGIRCDSTPPETGQITTYWYFDMSTFAQSPARKGEIGPLNNSQVYIIYTPDNKDFFCVPPNPEAPTHQEFQVRADDMPT